MYDETLYQNIYIVFLGNFKNRCSLTKRCSIIKPFWKQLRKTNKSLNQIRYNSQLI